MPYIQINSEINQSSALNTSQTNLFNSSMECPDGLKDYETAYDSYIDDPDVSPVLLPFTNRSRSSSKRVTRTASKIDSNHRLSFTAVFLKLQMQDQCFNLRV